MIMTIRKACSSYTRTCWQCFDDPLRPRYCQASASYMVGFVCITGSDCY
jgi:hypothetical protein